MKTCLVVAGILFVLFAGFVGFIAWQFHKINSSYVRFDPATYKGPTGKIVLASHNKEFSVFFDIDKGKFYPLHTSNGTIIAPTGNYTLSSVGITAVNSNNARWAVICRPEPGIPLSIKQGETKVLDVDQHFTARVDMKQNGSKANCSLVIKTAAIGSVRLVLTIQTPTLRSSR
jgi:hypothetical protein